MTILDRMVLAGDCRNLVPRHGPFDLIRTSCPPGGLVGDWFAGSGEASRLTGPRYLGCDIDANMAERARACIASVPPFTRGVRQ